MRRYIQEKQVRSGFSGRGGKEVISQYDTSLMMQEQDTYFFLALPANSKSVITLSTMEATQRSYSSPSQTSVSQPMGRDELPIKQGPQAAGFQEKQESRIIS